MNRLKLGRTKSDGFGNNLLKDLNRIDGKPTDFERKIFTGFEEMQKL